MTDMKKTGEISEMGEMTSEMHEARWERLLRKGVIVFGRIALAFLFFTQLWWKLPPSFGCPTDFAFKQETKPGEYTKSSGLCTWLGYESIFANKPNREILLTELQYAGGPRLSVNISPLAQLNGLVVNNLIKPNIRVMGYVIWLTEFAIFALLLLGLFSRLGGLHSVGCIGPADDRTRQYCDPG